MRGNIDHQFSIIKFVNLSITLEMNFKMVMNLVIYHRYDSDYLEKQKRLPTSVLEGMATAKYY